MTNRSPPFDVDAYIDKADSLPLTISALALPELGVSTHGTRCLQSAVRIFDSAMGPRGWDLDETETMVDTWTGDGTLVMHRAATSRQFVLRGAYSVRLVDQWQDLMSDPVVRAAGNYRTPSAEAHVAAPGLR